jgi:hypothetical protein
MDQKMKSKKPAAPLLWFVSLVVLAGGALSQQALAVNSEPAAPQRVRHADFEQEVASADARKMADWIVDSGDNGRMPFLIVDKIHARVFAFDPDGRIIGATAALLGMATGDDSVAGIGNRKLSAILPGERTTPAGRFVAALGRNRNDKDILWIDYDAAISLHRVVTADPRERRAERLASKTVLDNRISFGCINVPATFYETIVAPAFRKSDGIVYVLPETRSIQETFPAFGLEKRVQAQGPVRQNIVRLVAQPPGTAKAVTQPPGTGLEKQR